MSTAVVMERAAEASPQSKARAAGFFWLMTFVTSIFAMVVWGRLVVSGDAAATAASILGHETLFRARISANLLATICYVAVTLFVYELLKPVNRSLSLLAAFFSLVGCAVGAVGTLASFAPFVLLGGAPYLSVFTMDERQALAFMVLRMGGQVGNISLVFFGLHCLLIGCLILRSTFLPRIVGALMVIAGLGWLTSLWPPLANALSPYNLAPGMLGEGTLTVWFLVRGVNVQRWMEQAGAAGRAATALTSGPRPPE